MLGCICPAATVTLAGVMLTLPGALLARLITTPPVGAAAVSDTGYEIT